MGSSRPKPNKFPNLRHYVVYLPVGKDKFIQDNSGGRGKSNVFFASTALFSCLGQVPISVYYFKQNWQSVLAGLHVFQYFEKTPVPTSYLDGVLKRH